MKNKIKLTIAIMLLFICTGCTGKDSNNESKKSSANLSIEWNDLKTGLKKIKTEKKPAIMFFYTEWCTYCKKMDNEVFKDSEVISYLNSHFICIRVNPEKETGKIKVMKDFITPSELLRLAGGRGFPSTLFWDKNSKPVTNIPGYVEKKTFFPLLKYMRNSCYDKKVKFNDFVKDFSKCKIK